MTDSDGGARDSPRRYRNPPIEHRFRKGASANPKGRPRKERVLVSTKIGGEPGIGFEDRVKSLAIEEAYRTITIREGDRVEKVPVIKAIMRKLAFAAANGNIRAQQMYLNFLTSAEADRRVAEMELLKAAVDYPAGRGASPKRAGGRAGHASRSNGHEANSGYGGRSLPRCRELQRITREPPITKPFNNIRH